MKAREFADAIAAIGFLVGGSICYWARGELRFIGIAVAAGSLFWYFKYGRRLKGWVGEDFETLNGEYQRLNALAQRWQQPDGSSVPESGRMKILERRDRLLHELRHHPERDKHPDWKP
ncbi:MAG: hypothetical protein IT530_04745 [Burkholderiales bacterium]|nr:hypothetical protein [Burkholderiales bacterium]